MTTKVLTGRQAWWVEWLSGFDFIIDYRLGSKNPTDRLSWRLNLNDGQDSASLLLPTLQHKLSNIVIYDNNGDT